MKKVKKMTEKDGVSMRAAAVSLQISSSQITSWTKNVDKLTGHTSKVAKSLNTGWQSDICRDGFEADLLKWIIEQREMGFAVTTASILIYACTLSRNFKSKTYQAQYSAIERMVRKYSLVYRLGTRESQSTREEVDQEARAWLEDAREKLEQPQYSQDYILNMEQTAVYFSMHTKRTLSPQGQ